MSQTRRLAAILAADVVGYSRLMGEDEVGTARALREHRAAADPLIAEHGGRIVNTTGDGALIEFGSVVAAVQCAIALQQLMTERNAGIADDRRMDLRIGAHLGDVLAVPGFVSAQRFRLTDVQRTKPPHPFRYLALYEIETNDLQKTLDELGKRSGTPAMVLTDTMAPGTQAHIYEAITPVVTPKH